MQRILLIAAIFPAALFFIGLSVLLSAPFGVAATEIRTDDTHVVVDGDYIRIQTPGDTIEIDDDWRRQRGSHSATQLIQQLNAVEHEDSISLAMAGDVLFGFDSVELEPEATKHLTAMADLIRQRATDQVMVLGHTDGVGGPEYNQQLSERRALRVVNWLIHHQGIPAELFLARGMGALKPVAAETTAQGIDLPEGRAQNRRVEILVATRPDTDLRQRAETTAIRVDGRTREVSIGQGAVYVSEDRVSIGRGAIDVSADGVKIGGLEVTTGPRQDRHQGSVIQCQPGMPCRCGSRETCTLVCVEGGCEMSVGSRSTAVFDCPGGNCTIECGSRARCETYCPGGYCGVSCGSRSTCQTDCLDNSCDIDCGSRASCF